MSHAPGETAEVQDLRQYVLDVLLLLLKSRSLIQKTCSSLSLVMEKCNATVVHCLTRLAEYTVQTMESVIVYDSEQEKLQVRPLLCETIPSSEFSG